MTKVLAVDDEDSLCVTVRAFLVRAGYTVITAADGESALEQFNRDDVDVVITDAILPKRNGIALLQQIRAAGSRVPVIMMTGAQNLKTASQAIRGKAFASRVRAKTKAEAERVGKYMVRPALALERLLFLKRDDLPLSMVPALE